MVRGSGHPIRDPNWVLIALMLIVQLGMAAGLR